MTGTLGVRRPAVPVGTSRTTYSVGHGDRRHAAAGEQPRAHRAERAVRAPARRRPRVPVGHPHRAGRPARSCSSSPRASPTTSTARSPAGTAWCPGSGSSSTRSPTASTSSRPCSGSPGARSSRGGSSRSSSRRELFMAVVVLIAKRHGWVGLPVHFAGKAATFNLLYAFPLLLLADGDGTWAAHRRAGRLGLRVVGHGALLARPASCTRSSCGTSSPAAPGGAAHDATPADPRAATRRVDDPAHDDDRASARPRLRGRGRPPRRRRGCRAPPRCGRRAWPSRASSSGCSWASRRTTSPPATRRGRRPGRT